MESSWATESGAIERSGQPARMNDGDDDRSIHGTSAISASLIVGFLFSFLTPERLITFKSVDWGQKADTRRPTVSHEFDSVMSLHFCRVRTNCSVSTRLLGPRLTMADSFILLRRPYCNNHVFPTLTNKCCSFLQFTRRQPSS